MAEIAYELGAFDIRCGTSTGKSAQRLDSATDEAGTLLYAGTTNPITHIGILPDRLQGTTPTYKVSIQGNSSGSPDGTIKGGGSPASAEFNPSSLSWVIDEVYWIELDNSYTPSSANELIWITVVYSSGTVDVSNYFDVAWSHNALPLENGVGYGAVTNNNWSTKTPSPGSVMAIRTATERTGGELAAGSSLASNTTLSTAGNRKTTKFTADSDITVAGFRIMASMPSSGNAIFGIWNASGTSLVQKTHDRQDFSSNSSDRYTCYFDSPYDLVSGTDYYIGLEVDANSYFVGVVDVGEADNRLLYPRGTSVCLSDWNGSAWTDDTTALMQNLTLLATSIGSGGGTTVIVIEDD